MAVAKWLDEVFKDARLRAAAHDLARVGTHEQLRAALEAADKVQNKGYVDEDYRTISINQE